MANGIKHTNPKPAQRTTVYTRTGLASAATVSEAPCDVLAMSHTVHSARDRRAGSTFNSAAIHTPGAYVCARCEE